MDTVLILVAAFITILALNHGEAAARAGRGKIQEQPSRSSR
jgi:hypothetical protein